MGSKEDINGSDGNELRLSGSPSLSNSLDRDQDLALSAPVVQIYVPDVGTEPAQADVDHLCRVWAEVGRAILSRRQRTDEQEDHT